MNFNFWQFRFISLFPGLLAEMVEPPAYGPEYDWLWVVKYVGYALSILILIIFIAVVSHNHGLVKTSALKVIKIRMDKA